MQNAVTPNDTEQDRAGATGAGGRDWPRCVPSTRWPAALAVYLGVGLAVGIAQLPVLFGNFGVKAGIGNALAVNILLPLAFVIVTAWYPRVVTALFGAVLIFAGFLLGARLALEWRVWAWPMSFLTSVSPFAVVGAIVCAMIGAVEVVVMRPFRRVGAPDDEDDGPRCACGYALRGLDSATCPECGRARADARPSAHRS